jgi:hypothetical protein
VQRSPVQGGQGLLRGRGPQWGANRGICVSSPIGKVAIGGGGGGIFHGLRYPFIRTNESQQQQTCATALAASRVPIRVTASCAGLALGGGYCVCWYWKLWWDTLACIYRCVGGWGGGYTSKMQGGRVVRVVRAAMRHNTEIWKRTWLLLRANHRVS